MSLPPCRLPVSLRLLLARTFPSPTREPLQKCLCVRCAGVLPQAISRKGARKIERKTSSYARDWNERAETFLFWKYPIWMGISGVDRRFCYTIYNGQGPVGLVDSVAGACTCARGGPHLVVGRTALCFGNKVVHKDGKQDTDSGEDEVDPAAE